LTVSLIAVLIPLLFMGDVVGRLFREFAVTLAVTIILSAVVSLTLTPMMCSRILRTIRRKQGRFYKASERVFENMIAFYGRTLKFVLALPDHHAAGCAGHAGADGLLYIIIPKGFFPVQDTGVIQGISQAPADDFLCAMAQKQQELANHPAGSGGREPVVVYRRGRDQYHAEQRTNVDQPEAAEPARPERGRRDSQAAEQAWSR
jgi:multidrug efflux pump